MKRKRRPQVIVKRTFLVPKCPVCGNEEFDLGGNGSWNVFKTRAELLPFLDGTDGDTLAQRIANACHASSEDCGTLYEIRSKR